MDGLFKTVYGDGPVKAIPEIAILQKEIKFEKANKIGKSYNFPVVLSMEGGVTYLAAGSGISSLNAAIAATLKECSVDANQIIIRGQMDYEAAAKAVTTKEAFQSATELLVMNLQETGAKRLEIAMLYGQCSTGIATGSASTNQSSTQTRVTISTATWSGIFAGMENAQINFYKVSDDSLISSGANAIFTIAQVDFTNKYLYVNGTSTGIAALDTAIGAGNCYIVFQGAKSAEMVGLQKIATNTGTLFGISAASFAMWGGSTFSFGSAAVTSAKILNMSAMAVSKGGLLGEATVLLSPTSFMNLSGTMTDNRRWNGGSKETEGMAGFETITLMGPNGLLRVIPHPFIKIGEALLVPFKQIRRIGTQEFSFNTPGRAGELFLHIPDLNALTLSAA